MKQLSGAPQYVTDLRAWKTGAEVAPDQFEFKGSTDAKKLNPGELADFDELPRMCALKTTTEGKNATGGQ